MEFFIEAEIIFDEDLIILKQIEYVYTFKKPLIYSVQLRII